MLLHIRKLPPYRTCKAGHALLELWKVAAKQGWLLLADALQKQHDGQGCTQVIRSKLSLSAEGNRQGNTNAQGFMQQSL